MKCDSGFNEFHTIGRMVRTGQILSLSREELEECFIIVNQSAAYGTYSKSECEEIRNIVNMALVIKIGDDANRQAEENSKTALELSRSAVRVSKNAFFATIVAILIAAVSAGFSIWNILNPTPMQVYSPPNNPVVIQEISLDDLQQRIPGHL